MFDRTLPLSRIPYKIKTKVFWKKYHKIQEHILSLCIISFSFYQIIRAQTSSKLCSCRVIFQAFSSPVDLCCCFSPLKVFQGCYGGIKQVSWIQIRPDIISGLIWVQTFCNKFRRTTITKSLINGHVPVSFQLLLMALLLTNMDTSSVTYSLGLHWFKHILLARTVDIIKHVFIVCSCP